mmetsp:Transcript_32727/g.79335  ORF Transcript_32727/g.79335 Transcript_32727/m.79335 type:complete len:94 (+) Transcript_32727:685-966(+)
MSEISDPWAQWRLIAPPQAPAATPQMDLQMLPIEIMGRKKACGTKTAATSQVIPTSKMLSANKRHRLMSVRKRLDQPDVKSKFAAIPQPSRTK